MEAFRAFHHSDPNPVDPEHEEESRYVGAVLESVRFTYARESLKSLRNIEAILRLVHKIKPEPSHGGA